MSVQTHIKAGLGAAVGGLLLIAAACSESPMKTGPSPIAPSGTSNVLRQAEINSFELCKDYSGVVGGPVTFTVTVDQDNNGSIDTTFPVTLSNGQCQEIWTDVGLGRDVVTVQETVPTGYTASYVRTLIDLDGSTTDPSVTGDTASGPVATDDLGTLVIFTNTSDPTELGEGRFTGGGNQIMVGGVRVSRGLTLHCDLILSNNLEINWNGNKFHMTEHLTTVECSDDPAIIQAPPPAPLDTMIGTGEGKFNNVAGYTVEFTLQDFGEPGSADRAALKVYPTGNPGNPVLNVPLQVLSNGNLQAHFDQPHK